MTKLRPIILTCDNSNRLDTFKVFVESYKKISHTLLSPIVLVGYNDSKRRDEYNFLLNQLKPYRIIEQPMYYTELDIPKLAKRLPSERYSKNAILFSNTQKVMVKDFPEIALKYSDGNVIFMEDDICFSSKFTKVIDKVNDFTQGECDFITLYSPTSRYVDGKKNAFDVKQRITKNGYITNKSLFSNDFVHAINGNDYYGNQCVILNRYVLKEFRKNWKYIEELDFAWDLKWGRFLQENNFKIYATRKSYVQHQTGYSALEKRYKNTIEQFHHYSKVYDE
jgi:hypothetical protein|tara:strand:+ start:154 stop:993 length:840 start_codon:yes stop_codon:yes gene_type:complete